MYWVAVHDRRGQPCYDHEGAEYRWPPTTTFATLAQAIEHAEQASFNHDAGETVNVWSASEGDGLAGCAVMWLRE